MSVLEILPHLKRMNLRSKFCWKWLIFLFFPTLLCKTAEFLPRVGIRNSCKLFTGDCCPSVRNVPSQLQPPVKCYMSGREDRPSISTWTPMRQPISITIQSSQKSNINQNHLQLQWRKTWICAGLVINHIHFYNCFLNGLDNYCLRVSNA